ncbi:TlpA disulfide reductase family protein [Pedobacter sp. FW305-3-2-15-E-R2A2]|uniref:TlpA disulfide reductase family protein n=1 Tax=Pedobacter sp. FW305-3-2-15-E-R2A2 TaxID=3140251 RepID=UPI00314001BB
MKTAYTYCLALALWAIGLPFFSLAQKRPVPNYTLKGRVRGLEKNEAKVYLYLFQDNSFADSARVLNGSFSFSGRISEPVWAEVYCKVGTAKPTGYSRVYNCFIEKGNSVLNFHVDSLPDAKMEGSALNKERIAFEKQISSLSDSASKIVSLYFKQEALLHDSAQSNKDEVLNRMKILNQQHGEVGDLIRAEEKKHIFAHPSNFYSLWLASEAFRHGLPSERARVIFDKLSPELRATKAGEKFRLLLEEDEVIGLGKMASAFTLPDSSGNELSLSSYKGKYVLIDFWASWCVPCRAENPNVVKAYEQFKDKNFDVLGISIDTSKPSWVKALKEDHLIWKNVLDNGTVAKQYNVHSVPSNFLLDPNGKIIARNLRGDQIIEELQKIQSLNQ